MKGIPTLTNCSFPSVVSPRPLIAATHGRSPGGVSGPPM